LPTLVGYLNGAESISFIGPMTEHFNAITRKDDEVFKVLARKD
jgi:hypothetical protein